MPLPEVKLSLFPVQMFSVVESWETDLPVNYTGKHS